MRIILSKEENKKYRAEAENAWGLCVAKRSIPAEEKDLYDVVHDNFVDAYISQYNTDFQPPYTHKEKKLYRKYLLTTNVVDDNFSNDVWENFETWTFIYRCYGFARPTRNHPVPKSFVSKIFGRLFGGKKIR